MKHSHQYRYRWQAKAVGEVLSHLSPCPFLQQLWRSHMLKGTMYPDFSAKTCSKAYIISSLKSDFDSKEQLHKHK